jgi:hypothetical protein
MLRSCLQGQLRVLERIDRAVESGSLLTYNSSDLFCDEVS